MNASTQDVFAAGVKHGIGLLEHRLEMMGINVGKLADQVDNEYHEYPEIDIEAAVAIVQAGKHPRWVANKLASEPCPFD